MCASERVSSSRDKQVLLVDDDEDYLAQTRLFLERAGFRVVTAGSLPEARAAAEMRPDVAVLDMMMEIMDAGVVLSHELKRRWPDLPIILVTAVTAEAGFDFEPGDNRARAWLKADRLLAKPVRPEQLVGEIDLLLDAAGTLGA